jgi:hypothetical protein
MDSLDRWEASGRRRDSSIPPKSLVIRRTIELAEGPFPKVDPPRHGSGVEQVGRGEKEPSGARVRREERGFCLTQVGWVG